MGRLGTKDGQFNGDHGSILAIDAKQMTDQGMFEGYASVYGNVDAGGDIVKFGAFDDSLRQRPASKIKMLLHHDTRQLAGTWTEMTSDSKGLFVRGQLLISTQAGRDTYELMKAGALDAMSIGYRTLEHEYDSRSEIRTIVKADLMEVSLVTFPMNDQATISGVKNIVKIKTIREFEEFLRDEGNFSHAQAKAIASSGFKSLDPRDEDGAQGGTIEALQQLAEKLRS